MALSDLPAPSAQCAGTAARAVDPPIDGGPAEPEQDLSTRGTLVIPSELKFGELDGTHIEAIFSFHAPSHDEVAQAHERVRTTCREAAEAIVRVVPRCQERTLAIRALQQAMMFANAAIALNQEATFDLAYPF